MLLELQREKITGLSVLGRLKVDGSFECYTLESTKVDIPVGSYSIEITESPRFGRPLPLLDGVPGRSAVRIHPGNTVADTEGCILVGNQHTDTTLIDSRKACDVLVAKIQAALNQGDPVTITIQ